jgi:hypothetical protein
MEFENDNEQNEENLLGEEIINPMARMVVRIQYSSLGGGVIYVIIQIIYSLTTIIPYVT